MAMHGVAKMFLRCRKHIGVGHLTNSIDFPPTLTFMFKDIIIYSKLKILCYKIISTATGLR